MNSSTKIELKLDFNWATFYLFLELHKIYLNCYLEETNSPIALNREFSDPRYQPLKNPLDTRGSGGYFLLGWRILRDGDYRLDLPILSQDEEELIVATEERFRERARTSGIATRKQGEEMIRSLLNECAEALGIYLEQDQRAYLPKMALMHIYGFAFIDQLISDETIEEISIIGPMKKAYVYIREKGWQAVNACFCDEKAISDATNRMARHIGRHITLQNPRLDAMLPDGSRLHASLSPISAGEITIRRFRSKPFSPRELADNGTIDIEALALLSIIMQCDCSVVIGGNTSSGKTTTMNALFSFVPADERILIAEETPEINIPHPHQVRLVANRDMGITLKDLVYDSLRMRPDRMIVGEVRSREEAEALFEVLLAGQARGSYATLHAQSVDEGIRRLISFGIAEQDLASLDCLVIQRRMLSYDPVRRSKHEIRRVVAIAELDGKGMPRILYDGKMKDAGRMKAVGGSKLGGKRLDLDKSALFQKAGESFGMTHKELIQELTGRTKMMKRAGPDFENFFKTVQSELFGLKSKSNETKTDSNGKAVPGAET